MCISCGFLRRGLSASLIPGVLAALLLCFSVGSQGQQGYDVVIANGRVMDPESGLDAVRHIGISGSTIQAVSAQPLAGRTTVDAAGLIVAPGFIDLHQHALTPIDEGLYRAKAMDGVTTVLELEIGTDDVDLWYAARAQKALVNYGVSIGHIPIRMAVMGDTGDYLPNGPAARRAASEAEIAEMSQRLERGLNRGAVAVGFGMAYTPAATQWEVVEMWA
jgi:N-acyl-D-aspartate/D-glutamate deacylase